MITVTAPGKLLLLGEHAVVYGYPSLVTAVDQRLEVSIEASKKMGVHIDAPQVKDTRFVEAAVAAIENKFGKFSSGMVIHTKSPFSGVYGFGSSSAVTVATLQALFLFIKQSFSKRELFDLAYEVVLGVQGVGSGFDVASAIYGGTILYGKGGSPLEEVSFPTNDVQLVIGYSGVKSNTVDIVREVAEKKQTQPEKVDRIFVAIGELVTKAHGAILAKDWETVGKLMNFNQEYLRDLGVSSEKLESLISAAKQSGALGAKLSGAGGGDCMIALARSKDAGSVRKAITEAGGEVIDIEVNAHGVVAETTDNQSELFIVVDNDDNVLGYKTRYECHHDKSLIHRSVGVLVYDDQGRILLQKRSKTKDTDPGKWTISSSGHVEKGQEYVDAAKRELVEELGIDVPISPVKKFVSADDIETEIAMLYKATSNGPFVPNPHEVDEVQFVDPRELPLKRASGELVLTQGAITTFQQVGIAV